MGTRSLQLQEIMLFKSLPSLFSLLICTLIFSGCGKTAEEAHFRPSADPAAVAVVEQQLAVLAAKLGTPERLPDPMVFSLLSHHLAANPDIFGAAFAVAPASTERTADRSCPYVYRGEGGLIEKDLVDSYDYTAEAWYRRPVELGHAVWSEPYFDEGGGDIWMVTYSLPLYAQGDRLIGVVTSDLPVATKVAAASR